MASFYWINQWTSYIIGAVKSAMSKVAFSLLSLSLFLTLSWAQTRSSEITNPRTSPRDVDAGAKVFRSHCAVCHGLDGSGGRGPDLTRGQFRHASTDETLYGVIDEGITGTEMPAVYFDENQLWQIVSFVRSLSRDREVEVPGDSSRGAELFRNKGDCFNCHVVNGEGGRLGPDLTDVGSRRSAEFLMESVVDRSAVLHPRYRVIHVVGKDGKEFSGLRLNEDTYTVQVMTMGGDLLSLPKDGVGQIRQPETSLMQSYQSVFSKEELEHLTAYMSSLRRNVIR